MKDEGRMRELFIEELTEVVGGGPCDEIEEVIQELFWSTRACGEEITSTC